MIYRPKETLQRYYAWEPRTDLYDYQWRLRLLQSHWRSEKRLPMRIFRGEKRGAEIAIPEAQTSLVNYLTPTIQAVVRREVDDPIRSRGKVYNKPRIYNHLLSSQPLSFNLFGELAEDHKMASRVLGETTKGLVAKVTAIEFEWSPGRGDRRYTNDKSAFDVYVKYEGHRGEQCFFGFELKYHENLKETTNNYRARYDEISHEMGCFRQVSLSKLRHAGPLQQMWRDHLLAGSHQIVDGFHDGRFVVVYPEINFACSSAIRSYRGCLRDSNSFDAWTLESFVECLKRHTDAEWVQLFHHRYLDMSRLPL